MGGKITAGGENKQEKAAASGKHLLTIVAACGKILFS